MSTAVAEAPTDTKPPETKQPTEREVLAQSFLRPKVVTANSPVTAPPPTPEATPEAKAPETKPEPKPEAKPEAKPDGHKTPEESWAELRKKAEAAEKALEAEKSERARLAAEYEEFKKNPVPKEFAEKLTQTEKEKEEIRKQLQAAALERDPGFKKEYDDRINANAQDMMGYLTASGADQAEAKRAIAQWNEQYFADQLEQMVGPAKVKFQAAWFEAERIFREKQAKLANADQEWKQRETAMAEQQKMQAAQHEAYLKSQESEMFKELFSVEGLRENQELQKAAKEAVAASYQFTPKEIMHRIATATLLATSVQQKDAALKELQAKYDELKKKADTDEAFIKNQGSAVPRLSPTDAPVSSDERAKIVHSLLHPRIVAPGA